MNYSIDYVIKDLHYFKSISSRACAYLVEAIRKIIDGPDYPNSFIYDEYPDKITLNRIVDEIAMQAGRPEEDVWLKPLIEALLYQDITLRRCKKLYIDEVTKSD